jgi:exodeoxyribonuclease VII small subunit
MPAKPSKKDASPAAEKPSFEDNLKKLEEIVSELEQGNLPLDRSLRLYEEAISAYRTCHDLLEQAEAKITKLVETLSGELEEEPFEVGEEDS